MKKNIIFDWSGTLLNNFDQIYEITMEIFVKLGGGKISKEKYRAENISSYMKFWNKYFPKLTKEEQNKLFSNALKETGTPKLYPQIKDVLKDLSEKNIQLWLLSSQPEDNLKLQVEKFGISNYFSGITGGVHDKEAGFKKLLNNNNIKADETICVGDTIREIKAGKASDLTTVAITWGFGSREQLSSANPDYILNDLTNLSEIINK